MPPQPAREAASTFRFSTGDYPDGRRFTVYQEAVSDVFCLPLDYARGTAAAARPFYGEITARQIGALGYSRVVSVDHAIARCSQARCRDDGHLQFNLLRSGRSLLRQDGREARLAPGDIVMFDTRRPFTWSYRGEFEVWVVNVPRELLLHEMAEPDLLTARVVSGASHFGRIVNGLFAQAGPLFDAANAHSSAHLAKASLQVLIGALRQLDVPSAPPRHPRARLLSRARELIEVHLHEGDLSVKRLAALAGLSPCYLQSLFQEEGAKVSDCIRHRRLERCRWALLDPTQAGRSVSEIAFACGFNSLAHMSHRFKEAYGMAPSEFRRTGGATPLPQ